MLYRHFLLKVVKMRRFPLHIYCIFQIFFISLHRISEEWICPQPGRGGALENTNKLTTKTMSVRYKLYQDNRAESKNRGKWYARAVYNSQPKTLKQMAMEIQENVSVKKSDVLAVLDEMVVVLKKWMQDSNRVKIDGFGSFKIGLKTKPADTAKDFSASKHVVGARINFQPEVTIDAAGQRVKAMLQGLQVEETNENDVVKEDEDNTQNP